MMTQEMIMLINSIIKRLALGSTVTLPDFVPDWGRVISKSQFAKQFKQHVLAGDIIGIKLINRQIGNRQVYMVVG